MGPFVVANTDIALNPRDGFAAILVLIFGQQLEDVAQLTDDDLLITAAHPDTTWLLRGHSPAGTSTPPTYASGSNSSSRLGPLDSDAPRTHPRDPRSDPRRSPRLLP